MALLGSAPGSNAIVVALTVLGWYMSNISVLLLNKALLTKTTFKFPFFLTLLHMCSSVFLSLAASKLGLTPPCRRIGSVKQAQKVGVLAFLFCITVSAVAVARKISRADLVRPEPVLHG